MVSGEDAGRNGLLQSRETNAELLTERTVAQWGWGR